MNREQYIGFKPENPHLRDNNCQLTVLLSGIIVKEAAKADKYFCEEDFI